MVTKIVVLRRKTPAKAKRASAAKDSNGCDDNDQLQHKRDIDFDDDEGDFKNDAKNYGEKICLLTDDEAADGGFCDDHSRNEVLPSLCKSKDDTIDEGTAVNIRRHNTCTKRPLLLEEDADDDGEKKRQRKKKFIDLTDVPPQSPIMSKRSDGSSKYQGVSFNKHATKWQAKISVDGKQYNIGSYDSEEEAAIDYARAVFKYKAGIAGGERKQTFIDLTDVPPQLPIKSNRSDGSSKYQGVSFDKANNKWRAQIKIDGKQHFIGLYDNEEEAAIDYARAVFKYSAEITQKGTPSAMKHTEVPSAKHSVGIIDQTQNKPNLKEVGCTNHGTKIPFFSMDLVNKGGRIGIYFPEERKARIARFHAKRKRSTCVFK